MPYLLHNDVSHALKILAKEILLTWITRHIVYASLEVNKIEKIMKVINGIDTMSSSSLLKGIDINNNSNTNTKVLNTINDVMYIYDDLSEDNNSRKRKFLGNNDDSMIKKALEQITIFNSIESNNQIVQVDHNTISNSIVVANDSAANNNYEELLITCKACHVQINKYKVTSIGASSKLKAIVTSVISIIDDICNIESNCKKLEALNVLGLWLADDEILVQISEHYHKNDHIRTIVLVVFVGMLLLKARCIRAPAARGFLKAIELMIKCRADIAIAGLLSRVIRFPNHTNKSNNDCPIKIMTALIGNSVNTIPSNFQFELFQRSARQLLSKQQKDILLNNTFSNIDCNIVEVEFLKLLDGVLSPLAIMKSNDNKINIDTIFDEWKKLIGFSTLTSTICNSPILWDNENLKILNSVLTGCPEISVLTVRFILINLDDVAVGNVNICSSINLAAVLHTITTKCITVITNNEDLMKLARELLLRCSNPMAKNALAVLNNTVK